MMSNGDIAPWERLWFLTGVGVTNGTHKGEAMFSDTKDFNPEYMIEKIGGDVELAAELLEAYTEDAPQRLATLTAAIAAGDASTASRTAHSLKGMIGVVRVQGLVDLAQIMEQAGAQGDLETLRKTLALFTPIFENLLEQIAAYLNQA